MQKDIVQRLSQYKSLLGKLRSLGFIKVFSDNLADALGISAALVRKDFATFGLSGNKRAGYKIDELVAKLNHILGKDDVQKIIIVGCGKIGTALINYGGFQREGIRVVAGFDVRAEALEQPHGAVPLYHIDEAQAVIRKEGVQVAVLAVPDNAVSQVIEQLSEAGIRGVLNFAPVLLKNTERCIIHNINIPVEIENLFFYIRVGEKGIKGVELA